MRWSVVCPHYRWSAAALLVLLAVAGCSAPGKAVCGNESPNRVTTLPGGPEDIVHLALSLDRTRLYVREVCRGACGTESSRIGFIDVGPAERPQQTQHAWKPSDGGRFEPLGMSLSDDGSPDGPALYVIDAVDPPRIWKLKLKAGSDAPSASPHIAQTPELKHANDLQTVGDGLYVTRFDSLGFLPGRKKSWNGIVYVAPAVKPRVFARGLTGANGIDRHRWPPPRCVRLLGTATARVF